MAEGHRAGQPVKPDRLALGRAGEEAAHRHLLSKGWRAVSRNVRTRYGELDAVFWENDTLVFVEVKTRVSGATVGPVEAVTPLKAQRLVRLSQAYMAEQGYDEVPWRIDVIAVEVAEDMRVTRIRHIVHAVSE